MDFPLTGYVCKEVEKHGRKFVQGMECGMEVTDRARGECNSVRETYYQSATPTTIPQVQATFHKPIKSSKTD